MHLLDAPLLRPTLEPSIVNGLQLRSQAMVEKSTPVRKEVIGQRIGRLSDDDLARLEAALVQVSGLRHTIAPPRKTPDREQP